MEVSQDLIKVVCIKSTASRAQRACVRRLLALMCILLASCASALAQEARRGLDAIEHIVVIYAENRSFDHLFGLFPGANSLVHATNPTQVDHDGTPLPHLTVWKDGKPDPAFPTHLPNKPFRLDGAPIYRPMSVPTGSLVHRFYHNQEQINGGRNDRFVAVSDAGGLAMGYYDGSQLAMWQWAQEYTLADNFFMAAFGGSYLNHMWLVCACTPVHQDAPASMRAQLDAQGWLRRKPDAPASGLAGPPTFFAGAVTPDGYAVDTSQPPYQPSGIPPAANGDPRLADPAKHPTPPQTFTTIGQVGGTPMLPEHQIILRLVVAAVLGSIVGIERERLNWVAGLRTHMLVCVGSALFMIVSFCGFADVLSGEHVGLDPSRVAAQVVSGIGFLGAGTIVLRSKVVRGLTTAASLWTVAAVGLAVGGGLYVAAATTTGLIVIILAGIKPMERRLFRTRRRQMPLLILIIDRRETSLFAIEAVLEAANLHLQRMLIQHGKGPDEDRLQITVDHTRNTNVLSVTEQLRRIPGVREISHTTV